MSMKKTVVLWLIFCLLFTGCAHSQADNEETSVLTDSPTADAAEPTEAVSAEQTEDVQKIVPLPDVTMDNLTDSILSVSLEEGDAYVDEQGRMQMDLKIYTYDTYDMVDIAGLKVGDTLVRHSDEIKITSKEQNEAGTIFINGGLENGGLDLVTDDCGLFYEIGFNDAKNWYEIGETTIRVSADFKGTDNADPAAGEVILYPGDFLVGAVTNYNFTPHNTTLRVEGGQIVEMHRVYIP